MKDIKKAIEFKRNNKSGKIKNIFVCTTNDILIAILWQIYINKEKLNTLTDSFIRAVKLLKILQIPRHTVKEKSIHTPLLIDFCLVIFNKLKKIKESYIKESLKTKSNIKKYNLEIIGTKIYGTKVHLKECMYAFFYDCKYIESCCY